METQLQIHLSRKGEVVARFDDVKMGARSVGSDDECELLVTGTPCPGKLCQVHVSFDRRVHVASAGVTGIKSPEARYAARQPLEPGGFVDVDDFRLTLLAVRAAPGAVTSSPTTSPSCSRTRAVTPRRCGSSGRV